MCRLSIDIERMVSMDKEQKGRIEGFIYTSAHDAKVKLEFIDGLAFLEALLARAEDAHRSGEGKGPLIKVIESRIDKVKRAKEVLHKCEIESLIHTSAEDARVSLGFVNDPAFLEALLDRAEEVHRSGGGKKTLIKAVKSRIRQVKKKGVTSEP
jgi:hypothetical protein